MTPPIPVPNTPSGTHLALLPVRAELEWIACPCCGAADRESLLQHDSFGFPIGLDRCLACGFVYANPRPSERYMMEFYRRSYLAFYEGHKTFSDEYIHRRQIDRAAAERLERYRELVPPNGAVLDIGCGAGLFLAELKRIRPDVVVRGIEPGHAQAEFARQRYGLEVHEGVYQDFPDDRRYDLIVAFHVAEHLHDLPGFFRFCGDHLAPNGHLVIESPNIGGNWEDMGFFHIAHVNAFLPGTLAVVAARSGFRVTRSAVSERGWDRPNLHVTLTVGAAPEVVGPVPLPPEIRARLAQLPRMRWFWILKSWAKLALHFAGLGALMDRWRERKRPDA